MNRRTLLRLSRSLALPSVRSPARSLEPPTARSFEASVAAENWLDEALTMRGNITGRLEMSRFVEPVYFLLSASAWNPDERQTASGLTPVIVPRGFITDLASIPPIFFSIFRPDGEYAHAAVVHDFLYWNQSTTRQQADDIFKDAMRFLEVEPRTVTSLFEAVRVFGASAWAENQVTRGKGQGRILKEFPQSSKARWADWRQRDVFL